MANQLRRPGKKGRKRRVLTSATEGILWLERYITDTHRFGMGGQLPVDDPSRDIDYCTPVTDWPMYLNDQLGDCTIAGLAHSFSAMCVAAGKPEPTFSDAEITKAYSAVSGYVPGDPTTDQGADMATVCRYAQSVGLTDTTGKVHKLVAWGAIGHPADLDLTARVLASFGTNYLGINCQQATEDQFGKHEVLDWVPGSPDVGGHCVVNQRRQPGSSLILWPVTWGAAVQATPAWYTNSVEEAYALASEDFVNANGATVEGLDLDQLIADCAHLA